MRKAVVLYGTIMAGTLTETDEGEYIFRYDQAYLALPAAAPITLTMPLQAEPYVSNRLFAFFEGLIPEGWLLDIASKNWKLNPNDRMGLLLACCRNCIGAVSIQPIELNNE
jgi:serine/threonine-protein kinase HipA